MSTKFHRSALLVTVTNHILSAGLEPWISSMWGVHRFDPGGLKLVLCAKESLDRAKATPEKQSGDVSFYKSRAAIALQLLLENSGLSHDRSLSHDIIDGRQIFVHAPYDFALGTTDPNFNDYSHEVELWASSIDLDQNVLPRLNREIKDNLAEEFGTPQFTVKGKGSAYDLKNSSFDQSILAVRWNPSDPPNRDVEYGTMKDYALKIPKDTEIIKVAGAVRDDGGDLSLSSFYVLFDHSQCTVGRNSNPYIGQGLLWESASKFEKGSIVKSDSAAEKKAVQGRIKALKAEYLENMTALRTRDPERFAKIAT